MVHKGTGPDSSLPRSPRGPLNAPSLPTPDPASTGCHASGIRLSPELHAMSPHPTHHGTLSKAACPQPQFFKSCLSCPVHPPATLPACLNPQTQPSPPLPMPYIYLGLYPTRAAGGAEAPFSPSLGLDSDLNRTPVPLPPLVPSRDRCGPPRLNHLLPAGSCDEA